MRSTARKDIYEALAACARDVWTAPGAATPALACTEDQAARLERAAFASTSTAARGGGPSARRGARVAPETAAGLYAAAVRAITDAEALRRPEGPYPEDTLGVLYLRGHATAEEVLALADPAAPPPPPREVMRRMFVRSLMDAEPEYARNPEVALDMARRIEVACYNAAIRASIESEDPPQRHWGAGSFVDTYSARCGTIRGLLDPASSACRAYGPQLSPRLLSGAITPAQLGHMAAEDICPQALAAERAEVATRSAQKIDIKGVSIFECTFCKERNCTYQAVQLRSLDEASDYICYCLECKHRFMGRG
jgi:hypothetical protein